MHTPRFVVKVGRETNYSSSSLTTRDISRSTPQSESSSSRQSHSASSSEETSIRKGAGPAVTTATQPCVAGLAGVLVVVVMAGAGRASAGGVAVEAAVEEAEIMREFVIGAVEVEEVLMVGVTEAANSVANFRGGICGFTLALHVCSKIKVR